MPEECTNQDQYTKNTTRWQLHWWLDSQKHEPCNSTYSNEEAGRKNVGGGGGSQHVFPKGTENTAQTTISLDLQPSQHVTFHTKFEKAAVCYKLLKLLCQICACYISLGLSLFCSKDTYWKPGSNPHLSGTISYLFFSLNGACFSSFFPPLSSPHSWELSCQLGQQQSWCWAHKSWWTK